MIFGIDVIMIRPGAVATPIWDKADEVDVNRFANTPYFEPLKKIKDVMIARGHAGYPPERIARAVLKALTAARPRVSYTENPGKLEGAAVAILPKRVLDRAVAQQLGLTPRKR
jgi:short-subunit dehydrogenase